ncbi:MAG: undecaprenyl-diphosphate phosphatase [Planctomycetaceae bacterium]|nr:MAG: undecaprenyl-diphosphate phosphatase [Planctomycetaceae bacterium]
MSLFEMVILAIVQGIAEFLPISSSGHLVLVGRWLGYNSESATVEIILHGGTLGSILVVYWRRILRLLVQDRRVIPLLIVGTVPAVLVGLPIKLFAESWLKDPLLAGCLLLVTAALLLGLKRLRPGTVEYADLRWWQALAIGCFQAVAILPGISRSGATIFGGRWFGLRGDEAVTFSFLLAIPALSGATVLALRDLMKPATDQPTIGVLVTGALISFVLGIFALRWLMVWARKDRLHWFAAWCAPLGLLVIGLSLAGALSGTTEDSPLSTDPSPAVSENTELGSGR